MPNWCQNIWNIPFENVAERDAFHNAAIRHEDDGTMVLDLGDALPYPHYHDIEEVLEDSDRLLWIEFNSRWTPPEGIYHKLAEMFPAIDISAFYHEAGCEIAGYLTREDEGENMSEEPVEVGTVLARIEGHLEHLVARVDGIEGPALPDDGRVTHVPTAWAVDAETRGLTGRDLWEACLLYQNEGAVMPLAAEWDKQSPETIDRWNRLAVFATARVANAIAAEPDAAGHGDASADELNVRPAWIKPMAAARSSGS